MFTKKTKYEHFVEFFDFRLLGPIVEIHKLTLSVYDLDFNPVVQRFCLHFSVFVNAAP